MNVAVTGGLGFLGSHVVDALLARGDNVVAIDDMSNACPWALEEIYKRMSAGDFSAINCSILDLDPLTEDFRNCDAVVHCAALPYEGLSVFSPSKVVENVAVGSVNTMVAAIRVGAKRFLNCSSMARYGVGSPYTEDQVPCPVDPYGIAKLAAERQLNALGRVHGVSVSHVVPHNIVGPRQRFDDPYRNVASIMVNRMLQGKPAIIYGDGNQTRCFSDVRDVIPMMLRVLDEAGHGEVFNVGPDFGAVTINQLAAILAGMLEVEHSPVHVAPRPCEVKYATCSSQKIRRRFGFEARYTLVETLRSVVEYIKQRGPLPFNYNLPLELGDSPLCPETWKERTM